MGEDSGRDALAEDIAGLLLEGEASEEDRADTRVLAQDWRREAGDDPDSGAVLDLLKDDLRQAAEGRDAEERRRLLRTEVLDRQIRALGRETFALGKAVVDDDVGRDAARERGEVLLERVRELQGRVGEALEDRCGELERDLQEASLEALHAVEGGAMSKRLSQHVQGRE